MYRNSPRRPMGLGGGSFDAPRDVWILIAVIFTTFSLNFLTGGMLQILRLTSDVWEKLQLWQVATYPFIGDGSPGIWFLLELLILFWFSRDVYRYLGRQNFWRLIAWGVGSAAVAAIGVDVALSLLGSQAPAFLFLQGQRMLLTLMIAAFATVYGNATILLFFVLPIQAKWFLGLEILIAFMAFLSSGDLASFVGVCVAVGVVYNSLTGGGIGRLLRRQWLKVRKASLERQLDRERKKRGFRVIKGGNGRPDSDRWVN